MIPNIMYAKEKSLKSLEQHFQPTLAHLVGLFLSPPWKEPAFLLDEKNKITH